MSADTYARCTGRVLRYLRRLPERSLLQFVRRRPACLLGFRAVADKKTANRRSICLLRLQQRLPKPFMCGAKRRPVIVCNLLIAMGATHNSDNFIHKHIHKRRRLAVLARACVVPLRPLCAAMLVPVRASNRAVLGSGW